MQRKVTTAEYHNIVGIAKTTQILFSDKIFCILPKYYFIFDKCFLLISERNNVSLGSYDDKFLSAKIHYFYLWNMRTMNRSSVDVGKSFRIKG